MTKFARALVWCCIGMMIAASGGWALLALNYAGPQHSLLRHLWMAAWVLVVVAALLALGFRRWRRPALGIYVALFALVLIWWGSIEPANARPWQTDVAVLANATVDGDIVTVHNIRNFTYRSEFDYTPHYYDRRFDLRELKGVDAIAVYWMGPAIAHVFLSFEFANDEHLAISIETRKEQGEAYSTIKGFFRQYELYYVVADERDVIRLRTNFRRDPIEDVYVYRVAGDIANGRRLFLEYIRRINALNTQPEFYNTLTTNCTTSIWLNTRVNKHHLPLDWKILISGYLPQFLYEQGRLETGGLEFAELQRRAHVNARALAAGDAPDFSRRIRTWMTDRNSAMEAAP